MLYNKSEKIVTKIAVNLLNSKFRTRLVFGKSVHVDTLNKLDNLTSAAFCVIYKNTTVCRAYLC